MKRLRVLALKAEREKLLSVLQKAGCVQVTETKYAGADRAASPAEDATERLNRVRWAIGHLNRYDTNKPALLDSFAMPTVSQAEADRVARESDRILAEIVGAAEACERRSGELRSQEARIRAQTDQLLPWRALDLPVERIHDTRDTIQFIGTVPGRALPDLEAAIAPLPATLNHIGDEREGAFIWLLSHRDAAQQVNEALKAAGFAQVHFPGGNGTIAHQLDELTGALREVQAQREAMEAELAALAVHMPDLKILYELLSAEKLRGDAAARLAQTRSAFLLEGWAPADAETMLTEQLKAAATDIAIDFSEPAEDETPPTLLRNRAQFEPYESIVTSYSYPAPGAFDPTAIMAPFFACLFGMMLSDGGYGLVMTIAIPLIIKFLRPKPGMLKMLKVMFLGGIFTVFWGAIFNTWFGTNPTFLPMVIDTLNNPIPMLILCMVTGAIHMFTGLGIGAYMNIRRGKPLDAVYDQLSWVLLIVGAVLMVLGIGIGQWMAIAGVLIILLFAGREKKGLLSRLMSGGGALYGVSSWLSDLLSYMRLFGMGLATGVIGMVFNMLVGLLMDMGFIGWILGVPLLVFFHMFNFAINALGAYVHSCRLQYIEFFSKFYEDGGIPFTPLNQTTTYVAIRE
ncbi:MAG: V-type ATP synthase subunit I [Oscillospiraceae bacterium]|jgi:V/A-type H+-transporting ATPase subunit I|nr:V-type ATP synthase subunit I [Oscillospiraceae bacterium]